MRISTTFPLLLSASLVLAAPLVDLTKRQYCPEGKTVCAMYCCQSSEQCVLDPANAGGYNCKPFGDPNYQPVVDGIFTYTINPTPTVIVVTVGNGGLVPETTWQQSVETPGVTPGNTPGNTAAYTPGNTPGNTPTVPLFPPTYPTGSITLGPGTTTGSFITAIPTGTGVPIIPAPVTSGGGGLTAGQIGGIIGGVIGGLGLLGLLLLWCCLYGACALCRKKRHGSDSSSSVEGRRTWKSYIPLALAGGALANRHRHGHHSSTTITTEKKKDGGFFSGKTAIIGTLGAAYLFNKFKKDKETKTEYKPPKYHGVASGDYSSSGSGSYSSSDTRSHTDTSSSYLSHSSSSSGFVSNDSRSPPPARVPPPRRYR